MVERRVRRHEPRLLQGDYLPNAHFGDCTPITSRWVRVVEPEARVHPVRGFVLRRQVQERGLVPVADAAHEQLHQLRRSPRPRCAASVHTTLISVKPGGWNRSPAIATIFTFAAGPEVVPELDRSGHERARSRRFHEREHLRYVRPAELGERLLAGTLLARTLTRIGLSGIGRERAGKPHLPARHVEHQVPTVGQHERRGEGGPRCSRDRRARAARPRPRRTRRRGAPRTPRRRARTGPRRGGARLPLRAAR